MAPGTAPPLQLPTRLLLVAGADPSIHSHSYDDILFMSHNQYARSSFSLKYSTFDGIDACGERLAAEIRVVLAKHPSLREISLFGHSLGGLIARYAAGRLYDPATGLIAGLRPRHYVSIASPHLGCTSEMTEAQASGCRRSIRLL